MSEEKDIVKPIGIANVTKCKCVLSQKKKSSIGLKKVIEKAIGTKSDDKYIFAFQIKYKGQTRLKPQDILVTKNGIKLFVEREEDWTALLICGQPLAVEPNIVSTLKIYR